MGSWIERRNTYTYYYVLVVYNKKRKRKKSRPEKVSSLFLPPSQTLDFFPYTGTYYYTTTGNSCGVVSRRRKARLGVWERAPTRRKVYYSSSSAQGCKQILGFTSPPSPLGRQKQLARRHIQSIWWEVRLPPSTSPSPSLSQTTRPPPPPTAAMRSLWH